MQTIPWHDTALGLKHIKLSKLYPVFKENKSVEKQHIDESDFNELLKSTEYENGLVIMLDMHNAFISAYEELRLKSEQIIRMINDELKK